MHRRSGARPSWSLFGLLAAAFAAPGGAQTATAVFDALAQRLPVETADTGDALRFRTDPHQRMTVPVRLSGMGPYRFLVDTGSNRTAISRELATALALEARPSAQLHSLTGASLVATAAIPRLQFSQQEVDVADAPLLERSYIGADGMLGLDSLRSQRVMFDFKNGIMSLVPSKRAAKVEEKGTIVVRARARNGRLVLTKAKADGVPITIVLDTGAQVSIGNEALRQKLIARNLVRQSGQVQLQSVTGEMLVGEYMFLRRLDMAGVGLRNLAIVFAEAHTFAHLGLEDRPALLLGMNALRGFDRVWIDFANKKLRLLPAEHSSSLTDDVAARSTSRL